MATAKPSRSTKSGGQAAKAAADQRQRERLGRMQSDLANAKASQRRVEKMAANLVKKQLMAQERALAAALAEQRIKEMGGAGEGVGSPEQRAQASAGQRKAQQMRQTSKAVAATPKAPKGKQPRGRG